MKTGSNSIGGFEDNRKTVRLKQPDKADMVSVEHDLFVSHLYNKRLM